MWRTPQGNRILAGSEAAAFKAAFGNLVEDLAEWDEEHQTGVSTFDTLSYGQRLAVLEDLARAMFDPGVPPPAHTSANEAAIYAVYQQLKGLVEVELDGPSSTEVRRVVRTACYERGLEALAEHDDDLSEWDSAIESLSEQVLWDHDFADGDDFLDKPPQHDVNRVLMSTRGCRCWCMWRGGSTPRT